MNGTPSQSPRPLTTSDAPPDASRPARAFQFGLRTLLLAVAACGVLIAVMQRVGPLWSVAIVWFLVLAAAHVTANVWGTRSRRSSSGRWSPVDDDVVFDDVVFEPPPGPARGVVPYAPASRLRECTRLGWIMPALTIVGAIGGCAAGVTLLVIVNWDRIGASGIIVGGISCAVLGALLGFLTSTFLGVSLRALREASRDSRPVTKGQASI